MRVINPPPKVSNLTVMIKNRGSFFVLFFTAQEMQSSLQRHAKILSAFSEYPIHPNITKGSQSHLLTAGWSIFLI